MIILELFFAFIVALVLSTLLVLTLQREATRTGFLWVFLIIFLGSWAGGVWVKPFGPPLWGIYWLPFLSSGLIVALIFAVSAPQQPPRSRHETLKMLERIRREEGLKKATYITLSFFFWVLLFVLIAAIIIRYLQGYF